MRRATENGWSNSKTRRKIRIETSELPDRGAPRFLGASKNLHVGFDQS